jgi:hypothetical protein
MGKHTRLPVAIRFADNARLPAEHLRATVGTSNRAFLKQDTAGQASRGTLGADALDVRARFFRR